MIGRPQVLFLDEPATGVDPASWQDLWNLVRDRAAEGTTVLLASQYLDEADQFADRIAGIDLYVFGQRFARPHPRRRRATRRPHRHRPGNARPLLGRGHARGLRASSRTDLPA